MENLSKQLNKQPKEVLERVKFIARLAEELNYPVYAVGGFVRDLIMGLKDFDTSTSLSVNGERSPKLVRGQSRTIDLDAVVEGDGINFAKELHSRIAGSAFIRHRQFGTATVSFEDRAKVDIASARKEIYEHPASLPKVTFGTIKDDLGRRDFSINAMALDISRHNFGALVDFFGGTVDIKKKSIRALHEASFIDDPTRILRAIRFEQRFNFRIEPRTLRLIREALDLHMLEKVHNHRLRDELILILKEPQAIKCVKRINTLCTFRFIHSAIAVDNRTIASLEKIKSIHLWFEENFSHHRKVELWVLYLAVLLEGLGPRQQRIILSEFAFRKGEIKIILSFKEAFKKTILHLKAARSASHIYRILEGFSYEMILLTLSKTDNQKVKKKITDFLRHYSAARIFISGHDLKAHGITPGPDFKEILKKLLYAKLDGKFETKEEEFHYLRDKIIGGGSR